MPSPTKSGIDDSRAAAGGGLDICAEADAPDDTWRFWRLGEPFPRLVIKPATGEILSGDGTIAPAVPETSGALLAANNLGDVGDVVEALGHLGLTGAAHLTGTATWDPASLLTLTSTSKTVTVTGALVGDCVAVGFSIALAAGMMMVGAVTAADTVTVTLFNGTAGTIDVASGTVRADVWHG